MRSNPAEDPPPTVHRLRALTLLLNQVGVAFAARHGLSTTEVRALIYLLDSERAGEAAGPTRLATQLHITTASGTALLDRLESAGHVRRAPRTDDRRRVDIAVTASAKKLGWSFFGPLIGATVAVLETRTPDQRAVIDSFLDDMLAALHEVGSPGVEESAQVRGLGSAP